MFYQLPPVGNPVHLSSDVQPVLTLDNYLSPYLSRYYASGTAALAAAITAALRLKDTSSPEVILPAYGCPDLISAAIFAGAKPVLVDLEPDRPWMSLEKLAASITSRTVAIIAANLFGISERITHLRPIAEQAGAVLIEDSAQAFPRAQEFDFWQGDMVVLSFGRGKPVSLLGGGAVLYREPAFAEQLPGGVTQESGSKSRQALYRLKTRLYNMMISPWLYWFPQSLPFLHLGETRYHPLLEIEAMDRARREILSANIAAYQDGGIHVQNALAGMLEEINSAATGLMDLPGLCRVSRERRLLRYPVLVDAAVRDMLYQKLTRSGLGPSVMYPAALPGISGLKKLLHGQGPFPAAEAFAARLLTLPTHCHVREQDIANIRKALSSI